MEKISLILPVYNEEEGISFFHGHLQEALKPIQNRYQFEVIYVVDRSGDNTLGALKIIADHDPRVRVLSLSRRFGHQMSLVAGMDACSGDAAIMMDCDMEHPPALIPELIQKYEEGYDVVNTKRVYHSRVPFTKRITSALFYKVLNKLATEELGENLSDFRLVSRPVIDLFARRIREHNQYLRGLFHWVGFEQTTIDFTSGNRVKGKSKYTFGKLIEFAERGIISFSKMPLRISIGAGLVMAISSILYGIYAVITYFSAGQLPQGWSSTVTLIGFTSGFQLIILGIIGQYIGSIFDEVKNRPLYIVDFEYGKKAKSNPKRGR